MYEYQELLTQIGSKISEKQQEYIKHLICKNGKEKELILEYLHRLNDVADEFNLLHRPLNQLIGDAEVEYGAEAAEDNFMHLIRIVDARVEQIMSKTPWRKCMASKITLQRKARLTYVKHKLFHIRAELRDIEDKGRV